MKRIQVTMVTGTLVPLDRPPGCPANAWLGFQALSHAGLQVGLHDGEELAKLAGLNAQRGSLRLFFENSGGPIQTDYTDFHRLIKAALPHPYPAGVHQFELFDNLHGFSGRIEVRMDYGKTPFLEYIEDVIVAVCDNSGTYFRTGKAQVVQETLVHIGKQGKGGLYKTLGSHLMSSIGRRHLKLE